MAAGLFAMACVVAISGCGVTIITVRHFAAPTRAQMVAATLTRSNIAGNWRFYSRHYAVARPARSAGNQARYYTDFVRGWKETAQNLGDWTSAWNSIPAARTAVRGLGRAHARRGLVQRPLRLPKVGAQSFSSLFINRKQGYQEVFLAFRVGRMVGMIFVVSPRLHGLRAIALAAAREDLPLLRTCARKCR